MAGMRLALGVSYLGTAYQGWQSQEGAPTVQSLMEQALSAVADAPIAMGCAGRTDAGVHAAGQVIHCDVPMARRAAAWVHGANHFLPPQVAVQWVREVPREFDARRSALWRTYRYFIYNSRVRHPLAEQRALIHYRPLDEQAMDRALRALLGERDCRAFRGKDCQSRSTVRRILDIGVQRTGPWVMVEICANSFLQHMVRILVGSLLLIGEGRQPSAWLRQVADSGRRSAAGPTASPDGLYLWQVGYPARFGLPQDPPSGWLPGPWVCDLPCDELPSEGAGGKGAIQGDMGHAPVSDVCDDGLSF